MVDLEWGFAETAAKRFARQDYQPGPQSRLAERWPTPPLDSSLHLLQLARSARLPARSARLPARSARLPARSARLFDADLLAATPDPKRLREHEGFEALRVV